MTTSLLLLRCVQLGIGIRDLELLTVGTVLDMYTELIYRKSWFQMLVGIVIKRASIH